MYPILHWALGKVEGDKKTEKDSRDVSAHKRKTTTGYLHMRRWEVQGKGFWFEFSFVQQDTMGAKREGKRQSLNCLLLSPVDSGFWFLRGVCFPLYRDN